jgi:hypothetical protein
MAPMHYAGQPCAHQMSISEKVSLQLRFGSNIQRRADPRVLLRLCQFSSGKRSPAACVIIMMFAAALNM